MAYDESSHIVTSLSNVGLLRAQTLASKNNCKKPLQWDKPLKIRYFGKYIFAADYSDIKKHAPV